MDPISLGLITALVGNLSSVFSKANPGAVCFATTGQAVTLSQAIAVAVGGAILPFAAGQAIVMPALAAGTDYAIYACSDGTLQCSANFSAPAGYTPATSRQLGGFHYAPGSCAAAQAGGDTTPQINPYSLWDLKWRPACPDPRGMALVAGRFWADIYLTGTDVDAVGSSRFGVTIADGSSPPKIPAAFGGNGSTTYGSLTWFQARELLSSVGKDLLDYGEYQAAAYGVTEQVARGNDPVTTGFATTNAGVSNADQKFTSKWGIIQSTGMMSVWGRDLISKLVTSTNPADATALATSINAFMWRASTGGRGSLYLQGNSDGVAAVLLGATWGSGVNAGSRASDWNNPPWISHNGIGARGRSDHRGML